MDLVLMLNDMIKEIEKIEIDELNKILRGIAEEMAVVKADQNIIFLSNGKIIKCICEYYEHPDGKKIATKKGADKCFQALNELSLTSLGRNQCVQCHIECLEKLEKKELYLITKKAKKPSISIK